MGRSTIIVFCFFSICLTGCVKPVQLSKSDIQTLSSQELCQVRSAPSYFYAGNTQALARREIRENNIDCHRHHFICSSYGLQKGTSAYLDCRKHQNEIQLKREELETYQNLEKQRLRQEAAPPAHKLIIQQQNYVPFSAPF